MIKLTKKPLFNPQGDTEVRLRRMIGEILFLNDFTQNALYLGQLTGTGRP